MKKFKVLVSEVKRTVEDVDVFQCDTKTHALEVVQAVLLGAAEEGKQIIASKYKKNHWLVNSNESILLVQLVKTKPIP